MIADDSAAIRASLSGLFTRLPGVELVGIAHNGLQALEMIRLFRPDVVTLDVRMPVLTGIAVLEKLQNEPTRPIVIMLTGVAEEEYRQRCLALGASYFFNKATEFERVIDFLKERVRQSRGSDTP